MHGNQNPSAKYCKLWKMWKLMMKKKPNEKSNNWELWQ